MGQTVDATSTTSPAGVSPESVELAAPELRPYLNPSPLLYSRAFTTKAGCHVYLKVETIHPTRAFKVRGALTKLEMLRAIRLYFEWEHLLAEPAGAAALAALLYHYAPEANERVVVLLSGANVTDDVMLRALKAR